MYLCLRRPEECTEYGIIVNLRTHQAIVPAFWPGNRINAGHNILLRNEQEAGLLYINLLKWKLHILLIIIIIIIVLQVVHR